MLDLIIVEENILWYQLLSYNFYSLDYKIFLFQFLISSLMNI